MSWDDLTAEQQKRLQLPRKKLTKEERKLRAELFHGEGWIDAYGYKHKWVKKKHADYGHGSKADKKIEKTLTKKGLAL